MPPLANDGQSRREAAGLVRAPASSVEPVHGRVGLPAVVEELLVEVATDGFTLYCCGPKTAPHALVACYEWDQHVDLLTIRDFDRVTTARVPRHARVDIFAPDVVVWAYEGPPQQALRALLDLVHPAHPQAPISEYPAPASLRVARAQQRPMTIQPPSPGWAKVRAARLATEMTTTDGDRVISAGPLGTPDPRLARRLRQRPPTLGSRRPAGHQQPPTTPCPSRRLVRLRTDAAMPDTAASRWDQTVAIAALARGWLCGPKSVGSSVKTEYVATT
jgi:hypothetical protein